MQHQMIKSMFAANLAETAQLAQSFITVADNSQPLFKIKQNTALHEESTRYNSNP